MITWNSSTNLGTVSESVAISNIQLSATASSGSIVYSLLISDRLPVGLTMNSSGLISGTPVGNTVYKFVVRASNTVDSITTVSDRTFTLTVAGHAPVFGSLPATNLGTYNDVTEVSFSIVATDADTQDVLTYKLVSGNLPTGLSLSSTGVLSGIITAQVPKTYSFTVGVSDGTYSHQSITKTYSIDITNRPTGTVIVPIILNQTSNIGTYKTQDQFSYKIDATIDGVTESKLLEYVLLSGSLPTGLTLRSTGWIDGYLSNSDYITPAITPFTFTVRARYISNTGIVSASKTFTISIDSTGLGGAQWPVDTSLGTIKIGDVSTFDLNPHVDEAMTFRIKSGTVGILPPDLVLYPTGLIVGRVSFFNSRATSTQLGVYTFTVEMVNALGNVAEEKDFTVKVEYSAVYETLYLQAFPRFNARQLVSSIIDDTTLVPREYLYRDEDPNFGRVKNFRMLMASGIEPTSAQNYVAAMVTNHQRKVSYIKSYGWALAKDNQNVAVYEVVYGVMADSKVNATETSASLNSLLQPSSYIGATDDNTSLNAGNSAIINASQSSLTLTYPNSFDNMRTKISTELDFITTDTKPLWMSTLQSSGVTLGYANVVPLVYTKVGRAATIIENFKNNSITFNTMPFDVDGYVFEDYVPATLVGTGTGTIANIVVVSSTVWRFRINAISSTVNATAGDIITATAGTGSWNTNTVKVLSVIGSTILSCQATGGTIPLAGTVTNITTTAKISNKYLAFPRTGAVGNT